MKIKQSKTSLLGNTASAVTPSTHRRWIRRFHLLAGAMILFGSILMYGVYLGATLKTKHQGLRNWGRGLAQHGIHFIPNYIKAITAQPEHIDIDIKHKHFQNIVFKRQLAIRNQMRLYSNDDDWVPAKIRYKGQTYPIEMRLKGDCPDHWIESHGWSYKIKLKGDHTLFGMKRFAIQSPKTRGFLNEWVLHKLLDYSGLIHLRYDFIEVAINGKLQPIYAIEENFDKRLIENNQRREGPILRFDTSVLWRLKSGIFKPLPDAAVEAYQKKSSREDSAFEQQVESARNLLEQFRQGRLAVSDVFDAEKLAMYFAVLDLTGNWHASHLDNMKLYYNPVTARLEPVGYDCDDILLTPLHGLMGAGRAVGDIEKLNTLSTIEWYPKVFCDPVFFRLYIKSLEKISQPDFLNDFFARIDEELQQKLNILHKSFPWYEFDSKGILFANRQTIRESFNPIKAVHCYYDASASDENQITLQLHAIHPLPVEVLHIAHGDAVWAKPNHPIVLQSRFYDTNDLMLPRIPTGPVNETNVSFTRCDTAKTDLVPTDQLQLVYRVIGADTLCHEPIYPHAAFQADFARQDIMRQPANHHTFDFITTDPAEKRILIQPGDHTLDKNLILPADYTICIAPDTRLNLTNSALILSYSPLEWIGDEEQPIVIHSSDGTGQGLVVLNSHLPSRLEHVIFENLNAPAQGHWQVTGAVTFYESPVQFNSCRFIDNHSEDNLNVIRTEFEMNHCLFQNSSSDAFDADFCKGRIADTSFVTCGNDAVDVSGSRIRLANVTINGAGDKGLSAGENSWIGAEQVAIQNAEIAVAAKDLSEITINDLRLTNCRIGMTAYQKKPEFGPATITITKLNQQQSEVPYLIEPRSILTVENKTIPANHENVKDILYGVEYGKSSKPLSL